MAKSTGGSVGSKYTDSQRSRGGKNAAISRRYSTPRIDVSGSPVEEEFPF